MTSGSRLGPYEIVAPIGAGGMGEVYRARDTRLDRQVAVKILPDQFAHNATFKIRFQREAKTISQLSHPHICTLYDVGENYLVMELLDGESLAERLTKGALPLSEVVKYGMQIAQALGRAHRAGIIHRDLKPGNVMLTKHGAKLLDFGLAKGVGQPTRDAQDATEQKPLTAEGTVLGTFQYMAPEQLAGEEPDARTDIFALGLVLYEMATGRRAFEGKTRTSLVAAILSGEPRPMSELQPLAPRSLEHVVTKCLPKDPEDRWQSASDIAEELRWIGEEDPGAAVRRKPMWPWIAAASAFALIIGAMLPRFMSRQAQPSLLYTEVTPPENTSFIFDTPTMAIAPDGRQIALVMRVSNGIQTLWLRRFDSPAPRMLNGTEGAAFPFWSPDTRNICFFAE
jgi:serine/threonine protein kinase